MDADVSRVLHHLQEVELALLLELRLKRWRRVEVILDGALAVAADDEDLLDAARERLFDDVLDGRLIDDWQHLLRRRLRRRQEARTVAGRRNDCFSDFLHVKFP